MTVQNATMKIQPAAF